MIEHFLRWWQSQLLAVIPLKLRRSLVVQPALSLAMDGADIVLKSRQDRQPREILRTANNAGAAQTIRRTLDKRKTVGLGTIIEAPNGAVLVKNITVPIAAEQALPRYISFEMDRETPFNGDDVFWNYTVLQRQKKEGKLAIELCLVPKHTLAPLLELAREAGLQPTAIESLSVGKNRRFTIQKSLNAAPVNKIRASALTAFAAMLTALVIAYPFWRQHQRLDAASVRLTQVKAAAGAAIGMQREIDQLLRVETVLMGQRGAAIQPLGIVAAVTKLVPVDSYLTELSLSGDKLAITGLSARSSELLQQFAQSSILRDARFTAPIVEMGGMESFSVSATVAP